MCANDGVHFGGPGDATGSVVINAQGKLHLVLKGLPPHQDLGCSFDCVDNGDGIPKALPCGTANGSGKVNLSVPEYVDPTALCKGPRFTVTYSPGVCEEGWGSGS